MTIAGEIGLITQFGEHADADLLVDGIVVSEQDAQRQAAGEIGIESRVKLISCRVALDAKRAAEDSNNCAGRIGLWTNCETSQIGGAKIVVAQARGRKKAAAGESGRVRACGYRRRAKPSASPSCRSGITALSDLSFPHRRGFPARSGC